MRVLIIVLYFSLCATAVWSQSGPAVGSEPSLMEAFAHLRNVQTTWSNEIVRWENDGTSLVVTALVLEEGAQTASKLRGVRIDLSSAKARDQVYIDEQAAERTRSALEEIADASERNTLRPSANGWIGAKEFWPLL
jgi:hypothetical protein